MNACSLRDILTQVKDARKLHFPLAPGFGNIGLKQGPGGYMSEAFSVHMADVAKKAGVSRATVSRTLSNPDLVSDHTRERVLAVVRELDYLPNVNAQILAKKTSSEVGLLLRAPRNPIYGALYQWLQACCSRRGIDLVSAVPSAKDDEDESLALQRIVGTRPSGLLIATGSISLDIVRDYSERLPTVVLPRPVDDTSLNAVSFDEAHDARAIASLVFEHGHRRIAVATRPAHRSSVEHFRTQTMAAHLLELGANVQLLTYDSAPTAESFEEYFPESDQRGPTLEAQIRKDRTVIMFANDVQAAIHMAYMQAKGKVPGEDLSVTGMDGSEPWASALSLATVTSPVKQVADEAVELLALLLDDPNRAPERRSFQGVVHPGSTLAFL